MQRQSEEKPLPTTAIRPDGNHNYQKMKHSTHIPVKRLAEITDRLFISNHSADGNRHEFHYLPHRDDYYMIGVVTTGQFSLCIDFEDITITSGQALIITPGQVHYSIEKSDGTGFHLAFAPELMTENESVSIQGFALNGRTIDLCQEDLTDLIHLHEVLKHRSNKQGGAERSIASAIKSIILDNIPTRNAPPPNRYIRLVLGLRNLIKEYIAEIKSPSGYASMLNVSEVYLNEAVKCCTGMNVSNFIGNSIATLAKRELYYTSLTVREIAARLGFEDYSYFSRLFKRHSGISPKEFRNKYLE